MNELVLIRGLPGSGKSTLAKRMKEHKHLEADMFFMVGDEYRYDPSKTKAAHEWCQKMTLMALAKGRNVVVSNTFTRHWEMQPYRDIAERLGVPIRFIVAEGNFKNIHGVPEDVIEKMKERWEA